MKRMILKTLKMAGMLLLTAALLAVFYVTVIMGQPQEDLSEHADMNQPLLAASPAQRAESEAQAQALAEAFPVPALCCAPDAGLTICEGVSYDVHFEDGFARVLTLSYAAQDGRQIEVTSIYPARALSLLPGSDYRLVGAGPALAGVPSVRMEREDGIRLHAQTGRAVYAVTTAQMTQEELAAILRPLTLIGE